MTGKVFGIGFQKTATTTLKWALYALGYDVKGGGFEMVPELAKGNLQPAFDMADQFDAFENHPWPNLFREMDARYPGSKFILTLRDEESWIKSVVNHFGFVPDIMQKYTYGVGFPAGYEDLYLARYRQHNADVRAHFKDRPGDLLELNLIEDPSWDALCRFLDKPVPEKPFPYENKGSYSKGKAAVWSVGRSLVRTVRK
jgi:hypothetical protein